MLQEKKDYMYCVEEKKETSWRACCKKKELQTVQTNSTLTFKLKNIFIFKEYFYLFIPYLYSVKNLEDKIIKNIINSIPVSVTN